MIRFKSKLFKIGDWTILRLSKQASAELPSRGQVMVKATINDFSVKTPLEPDGLLSHWLRIDDNLAKSAKIKAGDIVSVTLEPTKEWSEPDLPDDLRLALANHPRAKTLWQDVTPMSRWEWVRWIRSTGNPMTRRHRIEVACSKLESGKRRPCCWNRNLSTEPEVSKSGILQKQA